MIELDWRPVSDVPTVDGLYLVWESHKQKPTACRWLSDRPYWTDGLARIHPRVWAGPLSEPARRRPPA